MTRSDGYSLAAENAELRQRVADLERENHKLKRKMEGDRKRNDPIEKFRRREERDRQRRKNQRFTDADPREWLAS